MEYIVKIPNSYQKNNIVSDSIYIILEYGIISLNIKYPMKYIIPFRLVLILFKIFIKILLFYSILKIIVNKFKGENLLYYLFDLAFNNNIL